MIPAGYLLKRVEPARGWDGPPQVVDVCSVASCVNYNVVDLQGAWKHNDFGVSNDPETLMDLVESEASELQRSVLFYFEAFEQEIESDGWEFDPTTWRPISPAPSASVATNVLPPALPLEGRLLGFDVVVFGD